MSDASQPPKKSAADLLARADELMRRNRAVFEDDIPTLDEEVQVLDVAPVTSDVEPNWDAVCENVYSRVMQQLDLYAEFGLRDRISRELRPKLTTFVEQLSAELSTELSDNFRRFVAQAIEEEVARMRAARNR